MVIQQAVELHCTGVGLQIGAFREGKFTTRIEAMKVLTPSAAWAPDFVRRHRRIIRQPDPGHQVGDLHRLAADEGVVGRDAGQDRVGAGALVGGAQIFVRRLLAAGTDRRSITSSPPPWPPSPWSRAATS